MQTVLVSHVNDLTAIDIAEAIKQNGKYKAQTVKHGSLVHEVIRRKDNLAAVNWVCQLVEAWIAEVVDQSINTEQLNKSIERAIARLKANLDKL